jgi:hypothetical protein
MYCNLDLLAHTHRSFKATPTKLCIHTVHIHLPPLRFHCVGGCWNRTQDFFPSALAVICSNKKAKSHPYIHKYRTIHFLFGTPPSTSPLKYCMLHGFGYPFTFLKKSSERRKGGGGGNNILVHCQKLRMKSKGLGWCRRLIYSTLWVLSWTPKTLVGI